MTWRVLMIALLACLSGCNPDGAIHPRPQSDKSVDASSLSAQDRTFIEKAAQGNNAEVACGGLADGRSSSATIVAFGHMMVADHGAANVRLAEIARKHAISLPSSLGDHQAGYDRLVDRKGEDFDREFARVMVDDHNMALQLHQDQLASGTDPLLRQYAAAMLPKIEAHLAQAKSLVP